MEKQNNPKLLNYILSFHFTFQGEAGDLSLRRHHNISIKRTYKMKFSSIFVYLIFL